MEDGSKVDPEVVVVLSEVVVVAGDGSEAVLVNSFVPSVVMIRIALDDLPT